MGGRGDCTMSDITPNNQELCKNNTKNAIKRIKCVETQRNESDKE